MLSTGNRRASIRSSDWTGRRLGLCCSWIRGRTAVPRCVVYVVCHYVYCKGTEEFLFIRCRTHLFFLICMPQLYHELQSCCADEVAEVAREGSEENTVMTSCFPSQSLQESTSLLYAHIPGSAPEPLFLSSSVSFPQVLAVRGLPLESVNTVVSMALTLACPSTLIFSPLASFSSLSAAS